MATELSGSPDRQAAGRLPGSPGRRLRLGKGGLAGFVLRRLATAVVVLAAVSVVVFAATEALPGDPAQAILGRSASPQALAALRRQLHLNRPVLDQYFTWIGGLIHGNLGMSLAAQEPVTSLLGDRLINSGFLVLVAAAFSIPLSVFLGAYAAWRRDRAVDTVSSIVLLLLAGLPEFVVGVLGIMFLATSVFRLFPAISYLAPGQWPWENLRGLVLPVATLVIAVAPYVARVMRASMVEVLESDYVEMARLKGLPERTVIFRHALPNALGPTFQVIALNLAYLAGGIVVVEYVFAFPGIGSALQSAVLAHDLPVVQVLALLIAGVYVVLNLCADVAAVLVTPRMRSQL
jgi:peptide/nickel transport system permease protein